MIHHLTYTFDFRFRYWAIDRSVGQFRNADKPSLHLLHSSDSLVSPLGMMLFKRSFLLAASHQLSMLHSVPPPFNCDGFKYAMKAGVYRGTYADVKHAEQVEKFCVHLYELAQDAESHVSRLDAALSTTFRCNFVPEDPIPAIVDQTLDFLTRLPPRHLGLPDLPAFLHPAYLIPSASEDEDSIAIQ